MFFLEEFPERTQSALGLWLGSGSIQEKKTREPGGAHCGRPNRPRNARNSVSGAIHGQIDGPEGPFKLAEGHFPARWSTFWESDFWKLGARDR